MKHVIRFSAIIFLLFLFTSCDSNNDPSTPNPTPATALAPAPIIATFNAILTGANEVSPNNSTATENAFLIYNETTKIFSLEVT